MIFRKNACFLAVVFLFTSCSVSKHLGEDARVHTKTNIEISNPEFIPNLKRVESRLYTIARPKPATGISKWQTNLYNRHSKKAKRDSTGRAKGIRGWIIRTIGLAPVYFDERRINNSRRALKKYFYDNGYFGTIVEVDTVVKKKEVIVNYHIYPKKQYHLRNIYLPRDSIEMVKKVFDPEHKSILKPGAPYNQTQITEERKRLTDLANNMGYLNVGKELFYFFVDTALGSRQADIYIQIQQPKDSLVFQDFQLNQNTIYANYTLSKDLTGSDTTDIDNHRIIRKKNIIRPKVLANIVGGKEGELYSLKNNDNSLTRLLDLGIYKFVNLKIDKEINDSAYLFNRNYYLTPGLMQDVTAEFEVNSQSNSFFGIAAAVTYSHKNIFKGAERIDVTLSGGIGSQQSASERLINRLDGAFDIQLTLPKLLPPFGRIRTFGAFVPKTLINFGNHYQHWAEYYTVNTFTFQYGVRWSRAQKRTHQFYPINVNQFLVKNITDLMRELFIGNPRLERSFSDVFILGLFYNYTLSTQTNNPTRPYFFMRTGVETSGNLAHLIVEALDNQQERPYKIFGAPYSQFLRLDGDFRYFIPRRRVSFATRFIAGIGIPYGNSKVLPYIKQYFSGGPNSIRAFQFRALGPGSVEPPVPEENSFIEQTGDIRLEANVEYRFPLVSYLKGALFVDAGNIWLVRDVDDATPEGVFEFNRFYKEIAVGTGFGLRLDLNVLVIRLDFAFPLRIPWREEGKRWVISEINLFNSNWRRDYVQWNFAIGYPF